MVNVFVLRQTWWEWYADYYQEKNDKKAFLEVQTFGRRLLPGKKDKLLKAFLEVHSHLGDDIFFFGILYGTFRSVWNFFS